MSSPAMTEAQIVRTIKAHIAKGDKAKDKAEQHYIAAGQYLKQLKDDCPDQKTFLEKVEREIGISKSRTYQLLQIGDGRKTIAEVRADTAKRTADTKDRLKLSATSGQNADTPEASAEAMKAQHAALDDDDEDDDNEFTIYRDEADINIVRRLVEAIGPHRTRARAKKIPDLVLKAVGKAALSDCQWCNGGGHRDELINGLTVTVACECTRRKRGEDFNALRSRLENADREQQIPQQDFSFGLE